MIPTSQLLMFNCSQDEGSQATQLLSTQEQLLLAGSQDSVFVSLPVWGRLIMMVSSGREVDLVQDAYTLGRSEQADIRIPSIKVSKRHCTIFKDEKGIAWIKDLSSNGTWINKKRIAKGKPVLIPPYARITLLPNEAKFIFESAADMQEKSRSKLDPVQSKYHFLDKTALGVGTSGAVFKTIERDTGTWFACKIVDKSKKLQKDVKYLEQEIGILRKLTHPNIVRFADWIDTPNKLFIFMEYVAGGDLFNRLESGGAMNEDSALFNFFQLLKAVEYLHSQNITHRDIKPENILLDDASEPYTRLCLADFGLAKYLSNENKQTLCGTVSYMAPEILRTQKYTKAVDYWSLGVVLFVMLTAVMPFPCDDNDLKLREYICAGRVLYAEEDWKHISESARSLTHGLLNVDYKKRLNVAQAFKHPWIAHHRNSLDKTYDFYVNQSAQSSEGSSVTLNSLSSHDEAEN